MGVGASSQPVQSSVTEACHYCKEPGHFKNNCPKLAVKRQKKSVHIVGEAATPEQQPSDMQAEIAKLRDILKLMQKWLDASETENKQLKAAKSQMGF